MIDGINRIKKYGYLIEGRQEFLGSYVILLKF
jgi:hypothetical protein